MSFPYAAHVSTMMLFVRVYLYIPVGFESMFIHILLSM